jgi:hypothetical protein
MRLSVGQRLRPVSANAVRALRGVKAPNAIAVLFAVVVLAAVDGCPLLLLHQLAMYWRLLCFAATASATVMQYNFGWGHPKRTST